MPWWMRYYGKTLMNQAGAEGGEGGGGSAGEQTPTEGGQEQKPAGEQQPAPKADDKPAGEDKPKLTDAEAKLLREVMQYKTANKTLEASLNELKSVLGDVKPEDVRALLQEKADRERAELEAKGEYQRILEQVKQENERDKGVLSTKLSETLEALAQRDRQIEEMTVGRSFYESAFIRDNSIITPSMARKEFGEHFELVDGQVVAYDKPRGAKERTPIVDANGNPKSFEDAIQALYGAHPESKHLLKPKAKPGAGSNTVDAGKKPTNPETQAAYGVSRISQALKNQQKG